MGRAIRFYLSAGPPQRQPGRLCELRLVLQRKGQLDEAILAFEKAVALNDDYAGARQPGLKARKSAMERARSAFQSGSPRPDAGSMSTLLRGARDASRRRQGVP